MLKKCKSTNNAYVNLVKYGVGFIILFPRWDTNITNFELLKTNRATRS
jgi:hypothetical protein